MIDRSEKGGVTYAQIGKLGDKQTILQNLSWKPDMLTKTGKRVFFPYLDIKFVKAYMIEVCGAGNVQFMIEKDKEGYAIGNMGIFIEGDWVYNSAIGVERDPSKKLDKTKQDKVRFKGNHSDAYKSCAELFGLIVPAEIKSKMLEEKNNDIYTNQGKKLGSSLYAKEAINTYLNNLNTSFTMFAQVYKFNEQTIKADAEISAQFNAIGEFLRSKGL